MAKIMGVVLAQAASHKAFEIFQDKNFRQLVGFDKLEQIEQDRIFNELVVSAITLLMFLFEAPDLRIENDLKEYYFLIKDEIPKAYLDQLAELGIEKKYLKDWERLIQMRYEEYDNDKLELRKAAMEMETKGKGDLTLKGIKDIQILLPIQMVVIGCHAHICRGKTKGKEELFRFILRQLGRFYVQIRVPLEGGKIDFLTKARVGWQHLKRKIFKSDDKGRD